MSDEIQHGDATTIVAVEDVSEVAGRTPKGMLWAGRILSGVVTAFMLFGGAIQIIKVQSVVEATTKLGFPESSIVPIGLAAAGSAILYAIPQTAVLGAILLTAYFGGAVATHVFTRDAWFFPVIFGIVTWLGLYLRDARVRDLAPIRRLRA